MIREIRFCLNGEQRSALVDIRKSLLEMLREDFSLMGGKSGCNVGECGACTVLLDGKPFDACIGLAVRAHGKEIRTVEGLERDGRLSALQQAFLDEDVVQCGFCIPGFLVSGTALLEGGRQLSREEIRRGLAGNLCRCTGYQPMVNAVERVQRERDTQAGE